MLGISRLLLAIAVALSHIDVRLWELNPGVVAVVSFYMISGYVMTGLLRRHFSHVEQVPTFYLDRFFRLFSQYFFFELFFYFMVVVFVFCFDYINLVFE